MVLGLILLLVIGFLFIFLLFFGVIVVILGFNWVFLLNNFFGLYDFN